MQEVQIKKWLVNCRLRSKLLDIIWKDRVHRANQVGGSKWKH